MPSPHPEILNLRSYDLTDLTLIPDLSPLPSPPLWSSQLTSLSTYEIRTLYLKSYTFKIKEEIGVLIYLLVHMTFHRPFLINLAAIATYLFLLHEANNGLLANAKKTCKWTLTSFYSWQFFSFIQKCTFAVAHYCLFNRYKKWRKSAHNSWPIFVPVIR